MRKYIPRFHIYTKMEGVWIAHNEYDLFKTCRSLKRKFSISPLKIKVFSRILWEEDEEQHLVKSTFWLA